MLRPVHRDGSDITAANDDHFVPCGNKSVLKSRELFRIVPTPNLVDILTETGYAERVNER